MSKTTILLFPTEFERAKVADRVHRLEARGRTASHICGFGVIESAISTTRIAAALDPSDCQFVLCGIAGSLSADLQIGRAYQFKSVACYGIGTGSGSAYKSAREMGWSPKESNPLQWSAKLSSELVADCLLTVCAASANRAEADEKCARFPHAAAEDMESFSVSEATRGFELFVVRGISNRAGNRNLGEWKIDEAMASVMDVVEGVISQ